MDKMTYKAAYGPVRADGCKGCASLRVHDGIEMCDFHGGQASDGCDWWDDEEPEDIEINETNIRGCW